MKAAFSPISLEKYVEIHLKNNPGTDRKLVTRALKKALAAYKSGAQCPICGNPIWVIGSAFAGNMCFTDMLL